MKIIKSLVFTMMAMASALILSTGVYAYSAPSQVTGLKQTSASSSSLQYEWDTNFATGYQTQISTDGVTWQDDSTTSGIDNYCTGLNTGKQYYVRVRAFNDDYVYSATSKRVYGSWSSALVVSTDPEEITSISQTNATNTSFTVKWDAPTGANCYKVEVEKNSTTVYSNTVSTNSITVKNMKNDGETMYVYVTPMTKTPSGFYADTYQKGFYDTVLVPNKPKNAKVTSYYQYSKSVWYEWDSCQYSKGYQVEVYNSKGKKIKTDNVTGSYDTVKGIGYTDFYKLRVRAYTRIGNSKKWGAWSNYTFITNGPNGELKSEYGSRVIKATWKKMKSATKYEVYISTSQNSGFKKVGTTKGTSLTIKKIGRNKLTLGKHYYVKLIAYGKVGKKKVKAASIGNITIY